MAYATSWSFLVHQYTGLILARLCAKSEESRFGKGYFIKIHPAPSYPGLLAKIRAGVNVRSSQKQGSSQSVSSGDVDNPTMFVD
ncbi:hypothetical protein M8J76_008125 [Diaphorina citri]|nr:hypothetical protein M8J75_006539 [Diaphorina citri]KAI5726768.1 hypothetical protein M8J76_008125 [Diaphorina citri]